MKFLNRSSIAITSLTLLAACGQKPVPTSLNSKASTVLEKASSNAETAGTSGTDANAGATNYTPTSGEVIISSDKASAPVVVAGATLTCRTTIDSQMAACEIPKASKDPAARIDWSVLPADGSKEVSLSTNHVITLADSTLYFVDIDTLKKGEITANSLAENGSSASATHFTYDAALPQIPYAIPIKKSFADQGIGMKNIYHYFGPADARMSSCSRGDTIPTTSHDIHFELVHGMSNINSNMNGICGLEGKNAVAQLTLPPPNLPIVVNLVPGVEYQQISQDVALPIGKYYFHIDNSNNIMPDGTVDSWQYDWFTFTGSTKDLGAITNLAQGWN